MGLLVLVVQLKHKPISKKDSNNFIIGNINNLYADTIKTKSINRKFIKYAAITHCPTDTRS
jgi:hypothetical protein